MDSSITTDIFLFLSKLDPHSFLTRQQVASFLQISLKTLYRRYKAGLIIINKAERNVRFEVQAVLDYIEHIRVIPA